MDKAIAPLVIKVGGALLDDRVAQQRLFAELKTLQRSWVLLHGGGALVDEWLDKLNFSVERCQGLRISPAEQMPFITGALAGCANTALVAQANKAGIDVVGLTMVDAGCQADILSAELGQVGVVSEVDPLPLQKLLAAGFKPLISSIAANGNGDLLNINADDAAVAIARTLGADLLLLSDVQAVLDGNRQPIASLTAVSAEQLIAEQVIIGGMAVKVRAALAAAQIIKRRVLIASWQNPDCITRWCAGEVVGTEIACETQGGM